MNLNGSHPRSHSSQGKRRPQTAVKGGFGRTTKESTSSNALIGGDFSKPRPMTGINSESKQKTQLNFRNNAPASADAFYNPELIGRPPTSTKSNKHRNSSVNSKNFQGSQNNQNHRIKSSTGTLNQQSNSQTQKATENDTVYFQTIGSIRMTKPNISSSEVSNKFWERANRTNQGLTTVDAMVRRPLSSFLDHPSSAKSQARAMKHLEDYEAEGMISTAERPLCKYSEPYGFLSSLGGNEVTLAGPDSKSDKPFVTNAPRVESSSFGLTTRKIQLKNTAHENAEGSISTHRLEKRISNIDQSLSTKLYTINKQEASSNDIVHKIINFNYLQGIKKKEKEKDTNEDILKKYELERNFTQVMKETHSSRPFTASALLKNHNKIKITPNFARPFTAAEQENQRRGLPDDLEEVEAEYYDEESEQEASEFEKDVEKAIVLRQRGNERSNGKSTSGVRVRTFTGKGNNPRIQMMPASAVNVNSRSQGKLTESRGMRPMSNLAGSRPVSGMSHATPQNFFVEFQKHLAFTDDEIPFEELFDRNEQTRCATFSKFGDLGFYSPVQRIGAYVQFPAKFKFQHLFEIMELVNSNEGTRSLSKKGVFEIPIQLAIIEDLSPFQKREKSGVKAIFTEEDSKRESVTNTLYPEYIDIEAVETDALSGLENNENMSHLAATKYMERLLASMGNTYDPALIGKQNYLWIDPYFFPPSIKRAADISLKRYKAYVHGNFIKDEEIPRYPKNWMQNALAKIHETLLRGKEATMKSLFQEIFNDYKIGNKEAILRYILKCPEERKRLHITLLLQDIITSAERIAREGGYSKVLFKSWHDYYVSGKESIEKELIMPNIVTSSLIDWFQDFSSIRLIETNIMQTIGVTGSTLSIASFFKLESSFKNKALSLLKNLWLRGAYTILKKFLFLRRVGQPHGKWTFHGFQSQPEYSPFQWAKDANPKRSTSNRQRSLKSNMKESSYTSGGNSEDHSESVYHSLMQTHEQEDPVDLGFDSFKDMRVEDLEDIRKNPAYRFYSLYNKEPLRLDESGYRLLPSETRARLRKSVGILLGLQMREIISKSLDRFEELVLSVESYSKVKERVFYQRSLKMPKKIKERNQIIDDHNEDNEEKQDQRASAPGTEASQNGAVVPKPGMNGMKGIGVVLNQKNQKNQGTSAGFDQRMIANGGLSSRGTSRNLEMKWPEFMQFQNEIVPMLRVEMVFDGGILKIRETEDWVKNEFTSFHKSIVEAFSNWVHPDNVRIEVKDNEEDAQAGGEKGGSNKKQKNVIRRSAFQGETIYSQDYDSVFSRHLGFIHMKEKTRSRKVNSILEETEEAKEADVIKHIKVNSLNERAYIESCQRVINHVVALFTDAMQSTQIFDSFKPIFDRSIDKEIKSFLAKKFFAQEEFKELLLKLREFGRLEKSVPSSVYFPMFEVSTEKVKNYLVTFLEDAENSMKKKHEQSVEENLQGIINTYQEMSGVIRRATTTAEEVEAMEKYMGEMHQIRIGLNMKSSEAFKEIIFGIGLGITSDVLKDMTRDAFFWPENLNYELKMVEEKHLIERKRLEESLKEQKLHFELACDQLVDQVKVVDNFTDHKSYKNYIEEILTLEKNIKDAHEQMESINDQEKKLFSHQTDFSKLKNVSAFFVPHADLWKSISAFMDSRRELFNGMLRRVRVEDVHTSVNQNLALMNRLTKSFNSNDYALKVVTEFKEEVQQVQKLMPLLEVICNEGLKERHWSQIEEVIGSKFNHEEGNLKEILSKNIEEHLKEVEEISENASKEFKLESMLDKMEKEWKELMVVTISREGTGFQILQGASVEEIQMKLDDHVLRAQAIRSNQSVKFMEKRAVDWEARLVGIQTLLELWVKVQNSFIYLEPIFRSGDIKQHLPLETTKFSKVLLIWNGVMGSIVECPMALAIPDIPNLSEKLKESMALLEEIMKGLEQYLSVKRGKFPRFFFLSNEDLLSILAETQDPVRVQPHIRKCFEGIQELIFSSEVEVEGMRSSEGEAVSFLESVVPLHYKSNVEDWLLRVEELMRQAVADTILRALKDLSYGNSPRTEWMKSFAGQAILCASRCAWTKIVEERMKSSHSSNNLTTYYGEMKTQLEEIVTMVRGDLGDLERITAGALIVLEVHARSVVEELLKENIHDPDAFEWLVQLRYYFSPHEGVNVKMITTSIAYDNEYLGNTSRLVITPLTDRCYRTLMSALKLNLGGAPEGPAGTGKTETVKDLAKAIAALCIVFNCSEGIKVHAMAKIFKGLASAGAWSCFDEFNRIELEVLSVIAQQILVIQQAKTQELETFEFDGSPTPLRPSCNIFITMNPGYAGRWELPDNLKVLFRPVAMMIPDYKLIAEISLYSFGFVNAPPLAKKIVITYKLCSEQLSTQTHYDYGMRAVKAVLNAAGALKRKALKESEDIVVLRSIIDVNLPKFLQPDVVLFQQITSDLFPKVVLPESEHEALNNAIDVVLGKSNLQNVQAARRKVLQLYDLINTRHGIMLVGLPLSGKSTTIKILASALTEIALSGSNEETPTHFYVLNPKSLTIPQIYGYSDPISKDWTEGVLARIFKKCAYAGTADRQWIVFDGPVDADWIENMNTVLDDNKVLCLMNSEKINMSNSMTILFETQDLNQASPATVSRCGMVYLQPDSLGWTPLFQTWLIPYNEVFDAMIIRRLEELFDGILTKALSFLKSKCTEYQPVPEGSLAISTMRILEHILNEQGITGKENKSNARPPRPDELSLRIDQAFIMACLWGCGTTVDQASRHLFERFLRRLLLDPVKCESLKDRSVKVEKGAVPPDTAGASLYDYALVEGRWVPWKDYLDHSDGQPMKTNLKFHDLFIETKESLRFKFILELAVTNRHPFLYIGPSGIGKTRVITSFLHSLPLEKFLVINMAFSMKTSANLVQDIIDSKLERKGKNKYGPPLIDQQGLFYIDDLNMPAYDKYFAQPPIELLRQYFDYNGWYDRKENVMMQIVNCSLVGSMGPPGGSRNEVTPRFLRHFIVYGGVEYDEKTLNRIFESIIKYHSTHNNMGADQARILAFSVDATIEIYTQILQKLRPTPTKFHYQFNLRDVAAVIQGVQLIKNSKTDPKKLGRLWINEIIRVFGDRLVTKEDAQWFHSALVQVTKQKLREDYPLLLKGIAEKENIDPASSESLKLFRFGDLMGDAFDPSERPYDEISSLEALRIRISDYIAEYNNTAKKPVFVILFDYALEYLVRLSRVLKLQRGNALLMGLSGSGRETLTKLVCLFMDYEVFQVEITRSYTVDAWRNDIKKLMMRAGIDRKPICFISTDIDMNTPFVLEDINSMLNTGDIPNLFPPDEFVPLIDKLRTQAKKESKLELANSGTTLQFYSFFTECVREFLHIFLIMSSFGDGTSSKVRAFPTLVTCCSVILFKSWPHEALRMVANGYIMDMYLERSKEEKVVSVVHAMYESCHEIVQEYKQREERTVYVTPTSYIGMISSLKNMVALHQKKIDNARETYVTGVRKLKETSEMVAKLQLELAEKQPKLIAANEEMSELIGQIEAQKLEQEPILEKVQKEKELIDVEVEKANAIKAECEHELERAKPALEAGEKKLDTIRPTDLVFLRNMPKPPFPVKMVLEALCILMERPPEKEQHPNNPRLKVDNYWKGGQKLIQERQEKLIDDLKQFKERQYVPPEAMERIRKEYISHPDFNGPRIERASNAAEGICLFVMALDGFEKILQVVLPRQKAFAEAQEEVNRRIAELDNKMVEVKFYQDKIEELENHLKQSRNKKDQLEADIEDTRTKLQRAELLTESLSDERVSWDQKATQLEERLKFLLGDILLSAGIVAYGGAFSRNYRTKLLKKWKEIASSFGILTSAQYSLEATLGEAMTVRKWTMCGLPSDSFSKENAIIAYESTRPPLMVDPQLQAVKWIKQFENENKLHITRLNEPGLMRQLEFALEQGFPLLIESVPEEIDPLIEPLILKNYFKNAGVLSVKVGDSVFTVHKNFRMIMTSKLPNPKFTPKMFTSCCVINFMITHEGLEDQLLELTIKEERAELEERRARLIMEAHENKKTQDEIEARILEIMRTSQGSILDDENAINVLSQSKELSNEILEKQKITAVTEKTIEEIRTGYCPIASHATVLFFTVISLSQIEPVYQYSLAWYQSLFLASFKKAEASSFLKQRIENLIEHLTFSVYSSVCRSMFEKDKLLFSFLLALKVMAFRKSISIPELNFFKSPLFFSVDEILAKHPNPCKSWLPNMAWAKMHELEKVGGKFANLPDHFAMSSSEWRDIYEAPMAHKMPLPSPFENATPLQKLCILKVFRPDCVVHAVNDFVVSGLDEKFVKPPAFDIQESFNGSSNTLPLLFLLPGTDPNQTLRQFAEKNKKFETMKTISLGQGQGFFAEKAIDIARREGHWVCLQNCHLAPSWTGQLERICELVDSKEGRDHTHPSYRLWLTSYSAAHFPISILQSSVKMTNEPPKGIGSNVALNFQSELIPDQVSVYNNPPKGDQFRRLFHGLLLFHAVIQERRTYGSLGWNIFYEFNQSDLRISVSQLLIFMNEYDAPPVKALQYLYGECNYGGRVTDFHDRRILFALLQDFFSMEVATSSNFKFRDLNEFPLIQAQNYNQALNEIQKMPLEQPPALFGFHPNAGITKDMNEANELCAKLLTVYGDDSSNVPNNPNPNQKNTQNQSAKPQGKEAPKEEEAEAGTAAELTVKRVLKELKGKLPKPFNQSLIHAKFPVSHDNSMHTILHQEVVRYNNLLNVISASLNELERALSGDVSMSDAIEAVSKSLLHGKIPEMWLKKSYLSMKPLGSYFNDLLLRIKFFQSWIDDNAPSVFWISGFFFTHSFLTGIMQNYARKHAAPIDKVDFEYEYLDDPSNINEIMGKYYKPADGAYVYGLFLEGCTWDFSKKTLVESRPKELYTTAPIIWLKPKQFEDEGVIGKEKKEGENGEYLYSCPVYKTTERKGVLTTTGHSNNFIINVNVPSKMDPRHWVKRGVAMVTQLNE